LFLTQTSTLRKVVFSREGPSELGGKGAVEVLQKCFQRFVSGSRSRTYIVDIAKLGEGFERCGVGMVDLQVSHEKDAVRRGHASTHGCAFDLQENVFSNVTLYTVLTNWAS